jgi:benzylsuccinate CoA-transferase BbsF subunit
MFPQAALDAAWNGREQMSVGNRSIEGFVPNGVFPCRGDDRWIAISCRSDAEWQALVEFMGSPAWALNGGLEQSSARAAQEDAIEAHIADWTATRDQQELFHALQARGITAGPVLNAKDAVEDPHLEATGAWTPLPATADYPATEFTAPAYRFSKSDVRLRTPPALFGEHQEYVYKDLLGIDDDEFERLKSAGHIADAYDSSVIGPS